MSSMGMKNPREIGVVKGEALATKVWSRGR